MNDQPKNQKKGINNAHNMNLNIDFVAQLKKGHREQIQQLQQNFLALEENCKSEIRLALKEDLSHDLKLFLNKSISQAVHDEFERQLPPLLSQVQEDVAQLSSTLAQTQSTLIEYKHKLSVTWARPFLLMLSASALTSSLLGLWLFLLQTSPLALFLMDAPSREAYDFGARWMESKRKAQAQAQETLSANNSKKKPKPSQ